MDLLKRSFDATVFTHNQQQLLAHGASRRNATHASTTDTEASSLRKGRSRKPGWRSWTMS